MTLLSLGAGCLAVILRPRRLDPTSRAWKEINLTALRHNAQVLQARAGDGCALMAVLKADAYGHGAVSCACALQRAGIKAFAVACLSEAIALRKAGIRGVILVLGYTPPSQAAPASPVAHHPKPLWTPPMPRFCLRKISRCMSTWHWIPACTGLA